MSGGIGFSWNDVAIVMTLGVFAMTIVLTIIGALAKHRAGQAPSSAPRPQAPQAHSPDRARSHVFVAILVFVVLNLCAPLPWLLFGQAGIPLLKLIVIAILLTAMYGVFVGAIAIKSGLSAAGIAANNDAMRNADSPLDTQLVARITLRFCPRCRAPLAPDAPEGLCPACLMAVGMASGAAIDAANGMAVTTPPSGSQPPSAGEWENLAERFPQLELLELLGRGGMGAVYKARQKHLDRFVALKVIPPEAAKDPAFVERFNREARALARLNHPNIVAVYDFGQVGDVFYLVMEYVDGVNLRHALKASRLAPSEALAIVPQICDALQYAHDQGVVHRDIKPENVLLDRSGRVKIADFGLAKMLGKGPDDFTLTRTQQVMGTPRYMAPEQIETPTAVDHRADIYSLGVVLYEMLTGELPLGRFQPPSQKVHVDVQIDRVVLRALEKEPDRRYQRASQVKTELASATRPGWQTPAPAVKHGDAPWSSREAMLRRVRGPAAGLQATGVLGLLPIGLAMFAAVYLARQREQGTNVGFGVVEVLLLIIMVPVSVLILIGGLQMWQLRGYTLARIAAVLAMLPCGISWLVGLPTGIWALVVLLDPEVRAAFEDAGSGVSPRHSRESSPPRGAGLGFGVAAIGIAAILLPCVAVLLALLYPAVQSAREAARGAQSSNNLKQLGLALHNYHDVYGSFPPAVVRDADGNALYSGRVLLLPFLEQQNLYQSFDLTKSWDSPENLNLSGTRLEVFSDPSDASNKTASLTNYVFVTGKDTIFEEGKCTPFSEITDGLSNTLAMIEVAGEINWAEPVDADLTGGLSRLLEGNHPGGNLILMADGSVRFLSKTTPLHEIRAMATIAGGELHGLRNKTYRQQPAIEPQPPLLPPAVPQPELPPMPGTAPAPPKAPTPMPAPAPAPAELEPQPANRNPESEPPATDSPRESDETRRAPSPVCHLRPHYAPHRLEFATSRRALASASARRC
jgi:predicted Ser/Thr protein kinase